MTRRLADLAAPDVARLVGPDSTVILPLGAIEQHGPHLPLSTDYVIADRASGAVAEQFGEDLDLWVLPTIPFTKSNEHAQVGATVWIGPETFLATLDAVGRSVAQMGAKRLVLLNGHGGNSTLANVACRELRLNHGLLTFLVHPFVPPAYSSAPASESDEHGMGIHGGHDETSVMLHLAPELVHMDRATPNVPDWLLQNEHVRFGGTAQFGWLANDFGPDGHIGDPTTATAEAGEVMFADAVALLGAQLAEIVRFDFP